METLALLPYSTKVIIGGLLVFVAGGFLLIASSHLARESKMRLSEKEAFLAVVATPWVYLGALIFTSLLGALIVAGSPLLAVVGVHRWFKRIAHG